MSRPVLSYILNGFCKQGFENPFSISATPTKLKVDYNYTDTTPSTKFNVSYNGGVANPIPNLIQRDTTPITRNYKSSINFNPTQLKNYLSNTGNTSGTVDAVKGWDKYYQFENSNILKRIAGLTPRPILNNNEQQATRPFLDNLSSWDVVKGSINNPVDAGKAVATTLTTPTALSTIAEGAGLASKSTLSGSLAPVLNRVGKLARPAAVVGLLSGLVNEARTVPEQVAEVGGYHNYIQNNSRNQSTWNSLPGYAGNVFDNMGKPTTSVATAYKDIGQISKSITDVLRSKIMTFLMAKKLKKV